MKTRQRGIALVTTLSMMVILMTVIGLLSMLALSDLRESRSSIQQMQARAVAEAGEVYARYAASSAAQQEIRDALRALMNVNVNPAAEWVIPESRWLNAQTAIESLLNDSYSSLHASQLSGLGSANVSYELSDFRGGSQSNSAQSYVVDYRVLSTGTANGAIRRVEDRGIFEIQIGKPSLSQYLFLVDDGQGTAGFYPTGARFNGPVHANHSWGFRGAPEFLDTITTAANGAYYWNAGECSGNLYVYVQGDSRPPCTVPVFAKGFTRNAPTVELPASFLSQQRAALGMDPENTAGVTSRQLCQALNVRPNCNSNSTVPDGIYVVNNGSSITGGFYIKGNLDELRMDGSSRDGRQTYTFRQGSTTVTVVVDFITGTTTVSRNGSSTTYAGTPNGQAPLGTGGPTGQIFVDGRISNLRGPGRTGSIGSNPPDHPVPSQVLPALAMETEISVAATHRIDLTSDLVYECDPTALADPSYLAQYPRCDTGGLQLPTVLGVLSLNEDVRITTSTPDNLYLWGSYLAGRSGRGLTVQNYSTRGPQGTLRLFGGLIQSQDKVRGTIYGNNTLASGYMETYDYDLRFANGSVAPPNFPTVRVFDVQAVIPVKLTFREF